MLDAELGWIATAFDQILLWWLRPAGPTYKRLTLMLRDPDRLEQLLLDGTTDRSADSG